MMGSFGLLGEKLGHSYSPRIHRFLGDYDYRLYEKKPGEVADFLASGDFDGLNVTIPYKKTALACCAGLSDAARAIGSVNTLLRRPDGSLYGDNTDAYGFALMLQRAGADPAGKKALVLGGTGGAGLMACHVLKGLGADPVVPVSRTGDDNYENLSRHKDAKILVNATPVGMYPNNGLSPAALSFFPACEAVLDLVYNPARTKLLMDAEALGIPRCGGLTMLVGQAMAAASLWTGRQYGPEMLDGIVKAIRRETGNLILVGMPGSGKTTLGEIMAQRMDRPFADADAYLAEKIGMAAPDFLRKHGEEAFRREETAVLSELGKRSGLVIATGGGCVTRAENYPLLHQNGTMVFIEREPGQLPREGRPLSEKADLFEMYLKRLPLYRRFADGTVQNAGEIEVVAEKVMEVYDEIAGD